MSYHEDAVILNPLEASQPVAGGHATLDGIFRGLVARHPERLALIDPPNRASFTDGAPRRLTYGEADRAIGAIAARLRGLGIPAEAVVGLQLPNTVEGILTTLGVLRAGMIAAPLPLLWRRADAVAALSRLGAKAIVTCGRVGEVDHCALAMEIAAELFTIRHVCGFGATLPDGVVRFDELLDGDAIAPPSNTPGGDTAAQIAVVTWDVTQHGMTPVARRHDELIVGGVAALLEGGVARDAAILTPCPPSSFAGMALGIVPWLMSGGSLALHQPFDPDVFVAQCHDEPCDTVVVPGPLLPRFAEAGLLSHDALRSVLALWRAPERLATSPYCYRDGVHLADVLAFGETGIVPARRNAKGRPAPIRLGAVALPSEAPTVQVVELSGTTAGTLALRGAMVPHRPFAAGAEPTAAIQAPTDTGYGCREDENGCLLLTGPPGGMVGVGGYSFMLRDLQDLVGKAVSGASFAAFPDTLMNHRLAGEAADRAAARAALAASGVNALIAGAFDAPNTGRAA